MSTVDAEAPLQPVEGDGELHVAHAPEQQLAGAGALDEERRVLLPEAAQRRAELVVVGLGPGHERHGGDSGGRHRAGRSRAPAGPCGRACRRSGWRSASTTTPMSPAARPSTADVLLAPQREEAVEALVAAGAAVGEVVVGLDAARQHPEERQVARRRGR